MYRLLSACLALGLVTLPVQAFTFTNPGFESGLAGWTAAGSSSTQTLALGVGPTEGINQALLTNAGPSVLTATGLETFLGLSSGALTGLGATEGSGLFQTFTAVAGDVVSFDWAFLTNEFVPEPITNDFGFFTLNGVVLGQLDTNTSGFTIPSASPVFDADTGYRTVSFTIATAGSYTLGFGVVDVSDGFISSGLAIDNIRATTAAIPEPMTTAGLLLGSALLWRRK